MKAIRVYEFGPPQVMYHEEIAVPKPGPGQVLVKIHAAGVNPVDTYIRAGIYPVKPKVPFTPGMDGAGVVAALGKGVRRFKEGARVYTTASVTGTYAEYAVCEESSVYPFPKRLSFSQAAAIGVPYATAYQCLFHKARAKKGETVLIHGASGGVGVAATQLARAAGLKIIGTAGYKEGLELVKKQGAHFVLNHRKEGYLDEVAKITKGRGVDLILEMIANINLNKDLGILALHGRVVVIGCRGTVEVNPRLMMGKDTTIMGMTIFNATKQEKSTIHRMLFRGFQNGRLKPVIGHELPLAEAARAHHEVMELPSYGKITLLP